MSEVKQSKLSKYIEQVLVAGLGGGIGKTIVAPFERLKFIYQTKDAHPKMIEVKYSDVKIKISQIFFGTVI